VIIALSSTSHLEKEDKKDNAPNHCLEVLSMFPGRLCPSTSNFATLLGHCHSMGKCFERKQRRIIQSKKWWQTINDFHHQDPTRLIMGEKKKEGKKKWLEIKDSSLTL